MLNHSLQIFLFFFFSLESWDYLFLSLYSISTFTAHRIFHDSAAGSVHIHLCPALRTLPLLQSPSLVATLTAFKNCHITTSFSGSPHLKESIFPIDLLYHCFCLLKITYFHHFHLYNGQQGKTYGDQPLISREGCKAKGVSQAWNQ